MVTGPCWRTATSDYGYRGFHQCQVMDPLHTGDHECCCGHEWPVIDDEWQETKRAETRET